MNFSKNFFTAALYIVISLTVCMATAETAIDSNTLEEWSAPYRGWYYYAEPVIPSDEKIPGFEDFKNYDCPCVFQLPSQLPVRPDVWYMSFIGFNGKGYNSFVMESDDLIHWKNPRLAMGFGPEGGFDHGGCVIGAYLYESYDVKAPRALKKKDGKFWTLYGCYPRQGGYELRPGYEGVAKSDDGLTWSRAKDSWILSVHDDDCGDWEKSCIYQPWLVEHAGRYYDFYNAAGGRTEQTGLAFSDDLIDWNRYENNPVVRVRPDGYDAGFAADPKVYRDGDHWTMIYFGVGRGGASIMIAFSRDLLHWTADPEPLYKFGGHPTGLDSEYAHKISLVYNPENDTFYMHYCASGNKGRCIALLTSRKLPEGSLEPKKPGPVRVSHVNAKDSVTAIYDGIEPAKSSDDSIPRHTFWDRKGTDEWIEWKFEKPIRISRSSIYWFDDTGKGSCRVPKSWRLSYRDGKTWKPVVTEDAYGTATDCYNTVRFETVETSALRIDLVLQNDFSGGVLEWKYE